VEFSESRAVSASAGTFRSVYILYYFYVLPNKCAVSTNVGINESSNR
jgi:hypothetical protein